MYITKSLRPLLSQEVLTLAWKSIRVLISNPAVTLLTLKNFKKQLVTSKQNCPLQPLLEQLNTQQVKCTDKLFKTDTVSSHMADALMTYITFKWLMSSIIMVICFKTASH